MALEALGHSIQSCQSFLSNFLLRSSSCISVFYFDTPNPVENATKDIMWKHSIRWTKKKHPSIPSSASKHLSESSWMRQKAPRSKYPRRPSLEHLVLYQSPWCTKCHTKKMGLSLEPFESLLFKKGVLLFCWRNVLWTTFGWLKHLKTCGKSWWNIGVSSPMKNDNAWFNQSFPFLRPFPPMFKCEIAGCVWGPAFLLGNPCRCSKHWRIKTVRCIVIISLSTNRSKWYRDSPTKLPWFSVHHLEKWKSPETPWPSRKTKPSICSLGGVAIILSPIQREAELKVPTKWASTSDK